MRGERPLNAAIVGTGFIGMVHARAVRSAGHRIAAVVNNDLDLARAAARRTGAADALSRLEDVLSMDDIDVVHICTPNSLHADQARLALEADKHVVCEKPLARTVDEAAMLNDLALKVGRVAAVPFVYRFYSTVRDAKARIAAGETGPLRLLHGSFLQDWLASAQDDNWRVDPSQGGESRAFGDIGVHWCDLMEFTTGHRIVRLAARLYTAHAERSSNGASRPVSTEDVATVMFETDQGAVGSVVISQVSLGRKNRLWFSFDGAAAAVSFDQEVPDTLWIGGRDHNRVVFRGSEATTAEAKLYDKLPAGHPQGFQDSFDAFVADVYSAVDGGQPNGLPTFADGLRANVLTQAVLDSARTDSWVQID